MSEEKMREEFEAWVSSQGFGSTWQKERNVYSDFTTNFAWQAWKARAAMQGEPELCQECGGDGAGGEHEEDCVMIQGRDNQ